jgi:hypothetical protein
MGLCHRIRGWLGGTSLIGETSVAACYNLLELWIEGGNEEVWNGFGSRRGGGGRRDMGDEHDFWTRLIWSVGWVDWLWVAQSDSNRVSQFRSSVANSEAKLMCNINIWYIYIESNIFLLIFKVKKYL